MLYLKADTAVEVVVGPAVAIADGIAPVTNLSIAGADEAELLVFNGASAVVTRTVQGTLGAITGADGYYSLDLDTGDLQVEGPMTLAINDDSLVLPLRHDYMVVNANVYDSLFAAAGTANLQTDTGVVAGAVWTSHATRVLTAGTNLDFGVHDTGVRTLLADFDTGARSQRTQHATDTGIRALLLDTDTGKILDALEVHMDTGKIGNAVWDLGTRVLTAGTNLDFGVHDTGLRALLLDTDTGKILDALEVHMDTGKIANAVDTKRTLVADTGKIATAIWGVTFAEPAQGLPAATASLSDKISFLYKAWRNRHTQTSSQYSLFADNATTVDQKATVSDDATTFDRTEIESGP